VDTKEKHRRRIERDKHIFISRLHKLIKEYPFKAGLMRDRADYDDWVRRTAQQFEEHFPMGGCSNKSCCWCSIMRQMKRNAARADRHKAREFFKKLRGKELDVEEGEKET
jgi:hypothetical protein